MLLLSSMSFSQMSGKIRGKVVSKKTGEPLIGANVMLVDEYLGAATDSNGDYIIFNVPSGDYSVKVMMISFAAVTATDVHVIADRTTELNFNLVEESLELTEVTIVAQRKIIDEDVTTSVNYLDKKDIESMPVTDYTDLLVLNPGMTKDAKGFHLRGGRAREVVVQVDGIPIQEPNYGTSFSGTSALSMNSNAISGISVQRGGFNAEFGNALSGIIDISTSGKIDKFHAVVDFETELDVDEGAEIPDDKFDPDYYSSTRYDYSTKFRRFRLGIESPGQILGRETQYSLSAQTLSAEDGFPSRENTANDLEEFILNGKFNLQMTPRTNLTITAMNSEKSYDLFDIRRKYMPDTFQRRDAKITNISLNLNHTLTPNLYYSVLTGYSRTYYKAAQPGKWWDITRSNDWNILNPDDPEDTLNDEAINVITEYQSGTQYIISGDNNLFRKEDLKTYLLKGSLSWQKGFHHQFKTGFEYTRYDLYYMAVLAYQGFPFTFAHGIGNEDLRLPALNPSILGLFLQDKIEFEGMVMNLGIRYDRFDPDAMLPSNFHFAYWDPNEMWTGSAAEDYDTWLGPDHDIPSENPNHPWKKASVKHTFSPRLGVSHPITDRAILHFTIGQFYQIPDWYLLYRNYNYSWDFLNLYGNPDLRPESTTSFEVGTKVAIRNNIVMDFTVFHKDIKDLVETVVANHPNDTDFQDDLAADSTAIQLPWLFINENAAWGTVKGAEFTMSHLPTRTIPVGINFSYTYMIAKGKTSDYHDGFLRVYTKGQLEPVMEYYLNWDQRHTLMLSLDYRWKDLSGINLLWRYGSGYPYTGYQESLMPVENNKRLPATSTIDFKINQVYDIYGVHLNCYFMIVNLFDNENVVNFDNGENRRIPILPHLLENPDEYEGPLDDPSVFGSHREIKIGVRFDY